MGGIGRKAPSKHGGPFVLQPIGHGIRRDGGIVEESSTDLSRELEEILILRR